MNVTPKFARSRARARYRRKTAAADASLPVYHQLYVILRQQIKDGAFSREAALPTELGLCNLYGASRVSVRRALEMLEQEELIVRRHGVGTFLAGGEGADGAGRRIGGLLDNLITLGLETTAKLLSYQTNVNLPPHAAKALMLAPSERGVHIERLRFYLGKSLSLTHVFLPQRLSKLVRRRDIDDRPVIRILEAAGLRAMSAEQTISAVVADRDVAAKLRVSVGSPLIRMQKTVFDREGVPFVYQRGVYNPDHYEYHMMLRRDTGGTRPQWRNIA